MDARHPIDMRTIQIAYDANENLEYWGKETATGKYQINRYYYDADDNLTTIKIDRLGKWSDRANLDWG